MAQDEPAPGPNTTAVTQSAPTDVAEPAPIIVTGTRIPRADAFAASPTLAIERQEIERFKEVNLEEFLNQLPQFTPDTSRSSNNPGSGTAQLNLRGLGSSRTLVLFNGRRLTPQGTGSAIDVNAIPASLIQTIEVVTGGASSIYGSDAVTGAVNFITRDVDGIEIAGQFDIYGAGDGESYTINAVAGTSFAEARGQITVFADYLERTQILGDERAFTEQTINENSRTGALEPGGSTRTPDGVILFPPALIDGAFANPVFNADGSIRAFTDADRFNFASDNFLQTPLQRWSAGALAELDLSADLTAFTELMFARSESRRQLAPAAAGLPIAFAIQSPFFTESAQALLVSAYDPDGDGIGEAFLGRRLSEVGPRRSVSAFNTYRAVLGARYNPAPDWLVEAHYSYGRVEESERQENDVSRSRLQQAILIDPATGACADPSGGCAPANVFGAGNLSTQAIEFIRAGDIQNSSRSVQHIVSATARGPIARWEPGEIYFSGGFEYRRNTAVFEPSAVLADGDTLGFFSPGEPVDGGFSVTELFGETVVPLLSDKPLVHRLEIEASARYSDYS